MSCGQPVACVGCGYWHASHRGVLDELTGGAWSSLSPTAVQSIGVSSRSTTTR